MYENVEWCLQRVCKEKVSTLCNVHALCLHKVHLCRVLLSSVDIMKLSVRTVPGSVAQFVSYTILVSAVNAHDKHGK